MSNGQSAICRRRWLYVLSGVILLVVVGIGGAFVLLTRPANVRAQVMAWLEREVGDDFNVGAVHFALPAQINIDWLHLGSPETLTENSQQAQPFARLRNITLALDPGDLLSGEVTPRSIITQEAEILLPTAYTESNVPSAPADDKNPQPTPPTLDHEALTNTLRELARGLNFPVQIDECKISLLAQGEDGPHSEANWIFDIEVTPASADTSLALTFTERQTQQAATVTLDTSGACHLALDPIAIQGLEPILASIPAARNVCETIRAWQIDGRLRVSATRAPSGELDLVTLLTDGAFTLPIEETAPATGRYAHFEDLRGSIMLFNEGGELELTGRLGAGDLKLTGKFAASESDTDTIAPWPQPMNWQGDIQLTAHQLVLPSHGDNPAFVNSLNLPERTRTLFDEFLPEGSVNIELLANNRSSDNTDSEWSYTADVQAVDARCQYYRFPYPVDRITGGVFIDNDRITFRDFVGHYGKARIFAEGDVFNTAPWTGFDLHFRGVGLPLDQNLYEAIPVSQRSIWDDAQLSGLIDVDLTLARPDGTEETGPQSADSHLRATLHSASLAFADSTLHQADVYLDVQNDVVVVNALDALSADNATLAIRGESSLDVEQPDRERWSIMADKHPLHMRAEIDDLLAGSSRTATGSARIPPIKAELLLDAIGDLHIDGDTEGRRFSAQINRGELRFFDPQRSFKISSGRVLVDNERMRLIDLHCDSSCGQIDLAGPVEAYDAADPLRVHLKAPAADGSVSNLLDSVVPPQWRDEAASFALRGATDIMAEFLQVDKELNIQLKVDAASAQPQVFPLPLRDVSAELTLEPDGFSLHQATGTYAEAGNIRVSGRGEWGDPTPVTELTVNAQNVPLDDAFIDAFPKAFAESLRRLTPRGQLAASDSGIKINTDQSGGWQVSGKLDYSGPQIDLGLILADFTSTIEGAISIAADGALDINANLNVRSGMLADRPLQQCSAHLGNAAGSQWIELREISGKLCGGEVRGSVDVEPGTAAYRAELSLRDLDFDQFVGGANPDAPKTNARVDGRIYVEGVADRIASRSGRGELRLTTPPVDRTPVLASVADASRKTAYKLPANADEIRLAFDWRGATLVLTHVEIQGSPLRLVGQGQWNMATDAIDLTLISAPLKLPASPIRDLLEIAGEELVQYRVSGTAKQPHVTLEPLHNMTTAVRELLEALVHPQR